MKPIFIPCLLFIVIFSETVAQRRENGIGLRLGYPSSITYKRYLADNNAAEFLVGLIPSGWHSNYYENSFEDDDDFDNFIYQSHNVEGNIYLQGRYLFHNDISIQGMRDNLDWYWGLGALFKIARVKYRYSFTTPPFVASDSRTDIDLGPEGIAGLEYTFDNTPLSLFAEISVMLEVIDRFVVRGFGGIGVRYNF